MWPFKQEQPDEVDLTNEAYERWLLAQRPPFEWFLGQDEKTQELLSDIGTAHIEDLCVAVALAIRNPEAADAGLNASTDPNIEEDLAKKIALDLIQKAIGNGRGGSPLPSVQPEPFVDETLTMAGVTSRREDRDKAEKEKKRRSVSFLGRHPDKDVAGDEP